MPPLSNAITYKSSVVVYCTVQILIRSYATFTIKPLLSATTLYQAPSRYLYAHERVLENPSKDHNYK